VARKARQRVTSSITGQLATILFAIEALRQVPKVPPLNRLKPGQLYKRIDDYLRGQGFNQRELTVAFHHRRYGTNLGVAGCLSEWAATDGDRS